MFEVLIVGGGVAGMSCALVLGSAKEKSFAENKRIGIIMHQKTSQLQSALFNNVLGVTAGTTGQSILDKGKAQLHELYPHVEQIDGEKVNYSETSIWRDRAFFANRQNCYTPQIVQTIEDG